MIVYYAKRKRIVTWRWKKKNRILKRFLFWQWQALPLKSSHSYHWEKKCLPVKIKSLARAPSDDYLKSYSICYLFLMNDAEHQNIKLLKYFESNKSVRLQFQSINYFGFIHPTMHAYHVTCSCWNLEKSVINQVLFSPIYYYCTWTKQ